MRRTQDVTVGYGSARETQPRNVAASNNPKDKGILPRASLQKERQPVNTLILVQRDLGQISDHRIIISIVVVSHY